MSRLITGRKTIQTLQTAIALVAMAVMIGIPLHYSVASVYAHEYWGGHHFHNHDSGNNRIQNVQVDNCNTITTATGGSGNGGNGGDSSGGPGGNADGGSGGATPGAGGGSANGAAGSDSTGGDGHGGLSFARGATSCSNHATNIINDRR